MQYCSVKPFLLVLDNAISRVSAYLISLTEQYWEWMSLTNQIHSLLSGEMPRYRLNPFNFRRKQTMKIVSVNVGLPREVMWKGRPVLTGIFKEPVEGQVRVRFLNLDGDQQADLTVHGGAEKAVYTYPSEHYTYWQRELPEMELPWGMFGENFTVQGLSEDAVNIGDRFRIGSAEVMVTQPRVPCYKLGIRFGRADIIQRFMASGLSGIYFSVVQEGEVETGDTIQLVSRDQNNVTVADITRLFDRKAADPDLLHRAIQVQALPTNLRDYFQQQLEQFKKLKVKRESP